MLLNLRSKLYAAGAFLIALLLGFLKLSMARTKRATKRAERAEAGLELRSDIEESDTELSRDLSSRKAEIKKELEEGDSVESLEKPNEW